jgi:TolA-binding protein
MQKTFSVRHRFVVVAAIAAILALAPMRAHAASKEIIALQTQVQQLLDMVQRMQSTMDTKFGVLQHLVEQTADNANQMTQTVNSLQQKLNQQSDALSGKIDTASGQVQSLNDSVDELKTRIAKLDKSIQDLQGQLQNIQSAPAGSQPATGTAPGTAPTADGGAGPGGALSQPMAANAPPSNPAPPLKETFQSGLRDFNAAKYPVATAEFQDVVHYYPMDDLAGSAQFYLGEIAYRQQDFAEAIKNYNAVLENFSGNSKAAAAQLHKGNALIQQGKRDAGIHEFRLLVQRHPQTPEAAQARTKLTAMGVHSTSAER